MYTGKMILKTVRSVAIGLLSKALFSVVNPMRIAAKSCIFDVI